jgi:hypothetical protein
MPFSATIVDGGRAIVLIYREAGRNKLFHPLICNLILNYLKATLPNPFRRGARGWGTLGQQNHATVGDNGSIMVGIFVSCVLASKKSSEREFFVPAGTDLAVKLLIREIMEILHTTGIHKQVGDPKKVRKKVPPFGPPKRWDWRAHLFFNFFFNCGKYRQYPNDHRLVQNVLTMFWRRNEEKK